MKDGIVFSASPEDSRVSKDSELYRVIAIQNLKAAKVNLDHKLYLECGMMCQASLEKILKGYLSLIGVINDTDSTHSLYRLAKHAGFDKELSSTMISDLNCISALHESCSYPEDEYSWRTQNERGFAEMVYNKTKKMFAWVYERYDQVACQRQNKQQTKEGAGNGAE